MTKRTAATNVVDFYSKSDVYLNQEGRYTGMSAVERRWLLLIAGVNELPAYQTSQLFDFG
jgi:hypothetical protein